MTPLERAHFIRANTTVLPVPLVPEISLHVAHESVPLWQKTEEELGEIGLPPPFWAFAWAGGQALARYVIDNPDTAEGKQILDLASGSGLVAIAALKAGAAHITAADIDAFAVAAISLNLDLNRHPGESRDPLPNVEMGSGIRRNDDVTMTQDNLLTSPPPNVETILVGDLFYEKSLAETVFAWLSQAKANGTTVLIGDPGRSYLPKDKLSKLAEYNVPVTRDLEDAELKRTAVWTLA